MQEKPNYWFPAKRYGWGWGPPRSWQGWAVLAVFFGLVIAGVFLFQTRVDPVPYIIYAAVLCVLLLVVCWLKGEPPRWRWGRD
jgi:drug/metabolite transporter (DMT)-like permease